jgi:hypothetical protein
VLVGGATSQKALKRKVKPKWKFIDTYDVGEYRCGLKAGDSVRLKRDIHLIDHLGNRTGDVLRAGEIWGILPGATEDPGVVWLRQPDGERHTWDDDPSIFEWFEKIDSIEGNDGIRQTPAPSPQPPVP